MFYCVYTDLLAVFAVTLKLNRTVDKSKESIIGTDTDIVAGMDVRCPESVDRSQIVRVGLAGTEAFRNKLEKILNLEAEA